MSTPTDQIVDITGRSQNAVTSAVRAWADTVQGLTHGMAGESPLASLQSVVDQYFDLTEQMLAGQREFARQWASAVVTTSAGVVDQAQHSARSAAAQATDTTEAVVDTAADTAVDTVEVAGENTAATVRAADDAVNEN